jgi:tryptophan halogenase
MGYVFSSKFVSDDQAIAEFLGFLGLDRAPDDIRVIPMNIGRVRRNWVNNCVAIGLAGGFVEPLEATALHFMQNAVRRFVDHFPDRRVSPELADAYNRITEGMYDEVRDIIAMHYCTSTRDDTPFWKAVRHDMPIPDSLARRLALWKRKLPGLHDHLSPYVIFNEWSYIYILSGKGYFDGIDFPMEGMVSDDDFREFSAQIERQRADLERNAPDHHALLTQLRTVDTAPWYAPAA